MEQRVAPVALFLADSPRFLTIALALLVTACAAGDSLLFGDLLQTAGLEGLLGTDDTTVVAGLREALEVGTERTVASTSRVGGFLDNRLIRIPLPEQLAGVASGLRSVGLGSKVDEVEIAMNRAAEHAAAEATPVFLRAIGELTFADARAILEGNDHAATDYFESHTRKELFARFEPIVDRSMKEVGLVRVYDAALGQTRALLPFVDVPVVDLRNYVTERGLDGLFQVLAQEEQRIREDPAARTTALLRQVFGAG